MLLNMKMSLENPFLWDRRIHALRLNTVDLLKRKKMWDRDKGTQTCFELGDTENGSRGFLKKKKKKEILFATGPA